MTDLSVEQIRRFRLSSHCLNGEYRKDDAIGVVGACGMQNTPPGAWETALFNRIPLCGLADMELMLYGDKSLVQAWSLRGAPVVFPAEESAVFLSSLMAEGDEPWIYTGGITLALDYLQMTFEELYEKMRSVMPQLNDQIIISKTALDQTIADWMLPLLPADKQTLWQHPSMYGSPDKQTVGGAVVSFMLRPCAFEGLIVFGRREGVSPTFTSYERWTGQAMPADGDAAAKLMRKFFHCYGPTTVDALISWLGCSPKQGRRLWQSVADEIEPVTVFGKKAYILSADRYRLISPEPLHRELLLLGGHDPYLDQRDRIILQPDKALHKHIWKMVTNPGAILYRGEIIGIWVGKKKSKGMEIKMTMWKEPVHEERLKCLAEEYATFRQQKLLSVEI